MRQFIVDEDFHPEVKGYSELVRCKDCKHRPTKNLEMEQILEFPDSVCPCQNPDDDWYSWYPADDWFCAGGERKDGDGNGNSNG